MKVLICAAPDIGLRHGGLQVQISKTVESLTKLAAKVVLYDPWSNDLANVDICHVFTLNSSMFPFIAHAKQSQIPVVISPVANSPSGRFLTRMKTLYLSRMPGVYVDLRLAKRMLELSDAVFALTSEEKELLSRCFQCDTSKVHIVHNGVDQEHATAKADVFLDHFGWAPDVLFVGRIDSNKNVLRLIKACNDSNLTLAIIGSPLESELDYYDKCRMLAGPNIHFLGYLPSDGELLKSAFAVARVFVLPSLKEVMPLTILEAVLAGCRIVITSNTAMNGILQGDVEYTNPRSAIDIRRKINKALRRPVSQRLQNYVATECTWEGCGERIMRIYQMLLTAKCKVSEHDAKTS
jgi:glycosyltransferase involved in cell wall biosynthesis